jgi:DNA topoisomerase VI subunit B
MFQKLKREVFATSRLLEFCSERELINQTGHAVEEWLLVVLKELLDNALDAAEEAGAAPAVSVTVADGKVGVADNGPGIGAQVVRGILDYRVRVSSREAYVSPTRGAQGNALKTILAMPYALANSHAATVIESKGIAHTIRFEVDHVRQEPRIEYRTSDSLVKNGVRITTPWPISAPINTQFAAR